MAEKTMREFSTSSTENIGVGPTFDLGEYDYDIKPSLIKMVPLIIFSGKKDVDAIAIYRIFWRLAIPLTFKAFLKMLYYFVCFLSH